MDLLLVNEEETEGKLRLARVAYLALASNQSREQWFERFTPEEGLERFYHLANLFPQSGVAGKELIALHTELLTHDKSNLSKEDYLAQVSRVMALIRRLSVDRPLVESLNAYDYLIESVEEEIRKSWSSSEQIRGFFERLHSKSVGSYFQYDLRWMEQRLVSIKPSSLNVDLKGTSELDQALKLLENIHTTPDSGIKSQAITDYCKYLEAHGVLPETVNASAFAERLRQGIDAKCVVLLRREDDRVTIRSENSLKASFASIISAQDLSIAIEAPSVRLGTVFLETTRQHEPQTSTPTPPSSNARIFPLLMGVTLNSDTVRFQRGSYLFLYNFQERKPLPGELEPVAAKKGFSGPELTLNVESDPARFLFVSNGGPGQKGAPPVRADEVIVQESILLRLPSGLMCCLKPTAYKQCARFVNCQN